MEIDFKSARKGLTQVQAAERCQVSLSTWKAWEAAGRLPDAKAYKLAALTTKTKAQATTPAQAQGPKRLDLKLARKGLTQQQAADVCKVSVGTWKAWEKSGYVPATKRIRLEALAARRLAAQIPNWTTTPPTPPAVGGQNGN